MAMTVCMYTPTVSGGHARYTHELLSAIARLDATAGIPIELVTSENLEPQYRSTAYPVHAILPALAPRDSLRSPAHWAVSRGQHYARRDGQFLRWLRGRPDIAAVHLQEYTPWLAPRHVAAIRAMDKAVFWTVHNIQQHVNSRLIPYPLFNRWQHAAWRSSDVLFVHTDGLREQLAEALGPGHPAIAVTPHGIWQEGHLAVEDPESRRSRHELLFFGEQRPNKGLDVLLQAMVLLPEFHLTIAGSPVGGPYDAKTRQLVDRLPEGQIRRIDRFIADEEMTALFAASSAVVLPYTEFAAQSGVLFSAMGHDLPVVVTDVGALGETVRRWQMGEIVPPSAPDALATAIRQLFQPATYATAAAGARTARQAHDWRLTAQATCAAYRAILAQHASRRAA